MNIYNRNKNCLLKIILLLYFQFRRSLLYLAECENKYIEDRVDCEFCHFYRRDEGEKKVALNLQFGQSTTAAATWRLETWEVSAPLCTTPTPIHARHRMREKNRYKKFIFHCERCHHHQQFNWKNDKLFFFYKVEKTFKSSLCRTAN